MALVEERGVTAAAKRLHLSQPATSAQLSRLREALQDPVLIRSGNQMLPTHRAQVAAAKARDAMVQIDDVFAEDNAFNPQVSQHRFSIGVTDFAMQAALTQIIAHLHQVAPQVDLQLQNLEQWKNEDGVLSALQTGELDFVFSRTVPVPKEVQSQKLLSTQWVTIANSQHPRIDKVLTLKRFLAEQHLLVSFSGDNSGLVDEYLQAEGLSRRVSHTVGQFLYAGMIVSETELLCTMAEPIAVQLQRSHENVRTLSCPVKMPPLNLSMYWHRRFESHPANDWLLQTVRRCMVKATNRKNQ